jgi:hypothetical protein
MTRITDMSGTVHYLSVRDTRMAAKCADRALYLSSSPAMMSCWISVVPS